MDNIGDVLKNILEKRGLWPAVKQQEVLIKWPQAVGEKIAVNTEATKITKGILWLKVKNSVWMHHLSMLKPELIKKINKSAGGKIVKDIYFFVGEIAEKNEDETVTVTTGEPDKKLSNSEIEKLLAEIPDQHNEIKQKIKKIIKKGY